jgi:hypothetical protein
MVAASLERVSNWKAVLAAMLYFATFLSVVYGFYSLIAGGAFLKSFAIAYPFAFAVCVLVFASSVAFEWLKASRKSRHQENSLPVHSYVHR